MCKIQSKYPKIGVIFGTETETLVAKVHRLNIDDFERDILYEMRRNIETFSEV